MFTCSSSVTTHNWRHAACFLTTTFGPSVSWLSRAKWWPSVWKAQTMTVQTATVAHLLPGTGWTRNRQKGRGAEKKMRARDEVGRSWKDWPSLRFVSRSFALKAERRNGERREGGKKEEDVKIERVSKVKFASTIPAFPTRLIKLWLWLSLNYITQLKLWFGSPSAVNEPLSEEPGSGDLDYEDETCSGDGVMNWTHADRPIETNFRYSNTQLEKILYECIL